MYIKNVFRKEESLLLTAMDALDLVIYTTAG